MGTSKFFIEINGKKYVANILTNFTIYDDLYCIYTVSNIEKRHDVYCAKIIDNQLVSITDEKELKLTNKIVNEFVESMNKLSS